MKLPVTTLCYIEKDGKYLMLHRTVKKNDVNNDKWIGVGGHFEMDESPEECVVREVKAKSGKTKSLKTVLNNKNVYHINSAIKLGQYNVGREENMLTIPLYMGFLIKDKLADIVVPDVDLTSLS